MILASRMPTICLLRPGRAREIDASTLHPKLRKNSARKRRLLRPSGWRDNARGLIISVERCFGRAPSRVALASAISMEMRVLVASVTDCQRRGQWEDSHPGGLRMKLPAAHEPEGNIALGRRKSGKIAGDGEQDVPRWRCPTPN